MVVCFKSLNRNIFLCSGGGGNDGMVMVMVLVMVICVLAPYRLVGRCQHFGETYNLHGFRVQGLKMKA